MKKGLKITLIVISIILTFIILDTIQALVFNNSPILKLREFINGGNTYYIDKGLFVNHYYCANKEEKTIFKNTKYACSKLIITEEIKTIDNFYNTYLTKNNDIRKLKENYNIDDAIKDNIFIDANGIIYNSNLYDNFMNNYLDKNDTYLRIARTTLEGDFILYDLLYLGNTDKLYLVIDNTRDEFSSDKEIKLQEYEKLIEYNNETILYNGDFQESIEKTKTYNLLYLDNYIRNFDFSITKTDDDAGFKSYYKDREREIFLSGDIKEFNIFIDNKQMTLKEYITNSNKTLEECIKTITNKLNPDAIFNDGGTIIYKSQAKDIMITVENTLEGDKDIYICPYSVYYTLNE